MQPAVIGIDVGGSKTHGVRVVTDARHGDTLVAEATVGSANIVSVGQEAAARQLGDLAEALGSDVDAVCVGAAGADTPQAKALLLSLARQVFPTGRVRVVHDTHLVLAAAGLHAGVVGISGTGSAAWGRNPAGDEARASGWGYLLGDEGSAYGVVRAAMRHVLDRNDDGQELDDLSRELMRSCRATSVHELLDEFYEAPSRRVWAARAPLVLDLASAGDASAVAIVDGAAAELVQGISRVCRRLTIDGPVVLAGGLAVRHPVLQEAVRRGLDPHGVHDVRVLDRDPVYGAVTLAQELAGRADAD